MILPDNYELAIGQLGEVIFNDKSIVDSHGSLTYNNTMKQVILQDNDLN